MDSRINTQKSALTGTYKVTPQQIDTLLGSTVATQTSEEDIASQYMQAATNVVWSSFED